MSRHHPHDVVIVGGGYAGAAAAVRAAGRLGRRGRVTLVDPRGALVQRLRLHQAAVGQAVASYDLHRLAGRRVTTVQAEVHEVDAERGTVRARGGAGTLELPFDSLVVAVGSGADTRGVPGVAEHAHTVADPAAAARLAAALRRLPEGARVAVVGGGLTGIETAAEVADAHPRLRVRLVCAGVFAGAFSALGRAELLARLERLGVDVVERAEVVAVQERALTLADDREVHHDLAVWCAGFRAGPLLAESALATDGDGRLLVDAALRSVSHPHVLAAGDVAAVPTLPGGGAFRMSCQAGVPSGAHAADTVARVVAGREPEPFDLGYVAWCVSLGRRDAVVQWVDRADRPKPGVLAGRRAALVKELVCRAIVPGIAAERRMPGSLRWLGGGRDQAEPVASAA